MTSVYSPGYHIYFDSPTPIFKARVNGTPSAYPVTALTFDTVTLGAFGDINVDMTLALGTTEGGRDLGFVRVQNFADATTIPIGRISRGRERGTLDISDNMYITVYDDFLIWAKIPRMILDPDDEDTEITTFKDSSVAVSDFNDEIPPLANAGPFFADYIDDDDDVITVTFPMNGVDISQPMAEGATIVGQTWDIKDGTLVSGALTDAVITATFPAGKRWVEMTKEDSNGKFHTARTFVLAIDPAADVTYPHWSDAHFSLRQEGQSLDVQLNAPLARATYPDGSLVLIWKDAPASPGDRGHMKFVGWQETEDWNVSSSQRGFRRGTTVHCVDAAGRMRLLPGFPQALERDDEVSWETMPDLTMNRVLHYLGYWHTTAWNLTDVILPSDDDYPLMRRDTGADNIFDQIDSNAKLMVPGQVLTCTPQGQLIFQTDWNEIDIGDRPAASPIITEAEIASLQVNYNPHPRIHSLHSGAIKTSTDWVIIGGERDVPLVFSIAPGDAFSQGMQQVVQGEGIAKSQEDLNMVCGHRYARLNSKYAPWNIGFATSFDFWEYAPAFMQRAQLSLTATYAAQRGLEFTTEEGMIRDASIRIENSKNGYRSSFSISWEPETSGFAGTTHIPEDSDEPEYNPPPPVPTDPPGIGESERVMAGIGIDGYVYRTFNLHETPVWDRQDTGIADTIYSWVVDPFSPRYISGSGAVNGWIAADDGIYRVEDLFGTVSAELVYSFFEPTVGASYHWRQISASFGAFFGSGFNPWLVCVSYYADTVGREGTWATYSTDGGATWQDEVQISAYFSEDTPLRFDPIALWLSPRTPGLGYTVAYSAADADPDMLPIWCNWSVPAVSGTYSSPAVSQSISSSVTLTGVSSGNDGRNLVMIPPANTIRVLIEGSWNASASWNNNDGSPNIGTSMTLDKPTVVGQTEDMTYVAPDLDPALSAGTSQVGFQVEWTLLSGTDWPVNRTSIVGTPLTAEGTPPACRLDINISGNCSDPGKVESVSVGATLRVVEIEFDGNVVYTPPTAAISLFRTTDWGATWVAVENFIDPGDAFSGTIHIPFFDNALENIALYGSFDKTTVRAFRLLRATGASSEDISPAAAGVIYGINRGPFGVRTFDGAGGQQFILAAVMGNETSLDPDDDLHALYISDDEGATWDEVIAPFADSLAPTDRPALEAAFSGSSEQTFFIWGPPDYFSLSVDFGATVLDKSGNLSSFSLPGFIGIAGGSP